MDRCNFRCPYCMPRETFHENYQFLKSSERLSFEEITRLARLFVAWAYARSASRAASRCCAPICRISIGDLTTIAGVEDVALTTNGSCSRGMRPSSRPTACNA